MKKIGLLILSFVLLFPIVSSLNLNVTQKNVEPIYIVGTGDSIFFNLSIKNTGQGTTINLYTLSGFELLPKEKITLAFGETKDIAVELKPIKEIDIRGPYSVSYYIRESDNQQQEAFLDMRVFELKDAIDIGFSELDPSSSNFKIYVNNKANYPFNHMNIKFSSSFFDLEKTFDLAPNGKNEFIVSLDRENFKKLMAGFYTLEADVNFNGIEAIIEKPIKFIEKDIIETTTEDRGFIIKEQIITKENKGNTVSSSYSIVEKNIISRLFTSFSVKPTSVDRNGWTIYYIWLTELQPSQKIQINIKTNWFFPLLIVLFVVAIVFFAKQYSHNDLVVKKRASFIRAKGGEFGIKVSVLIQAKKYVENVTLTDKIPTLVKLYHNFSGTYPSKIDEKARKMEWNFNSLEAGERRVMTYVVYSKLGIIGRFALPRAFAIYQRDGNIKETSSNRTFFIAEQSPREVGY